MNELEVITYTDKTPIEVLLQVDEDGTVSARKVYEFLGYAGSQFKRWARTYILEEKFAVENEDYKVFDSSVENYHGGRPGLDYKLTVFFAKKICMQQRNERGDQARNYFAKVEETLKAVVQQNTLPQLTTSEMILQLAQNNVALEKRINANEQEIQEIKQTTQEIKQATDKLQTALTVFAAPTIDHWQADMKNAINAIIEAQGLNPVKFKGQLYKELESTGNYLLQSRLLRLRGRLKKQGATFAERQALTKLDVISKSKDLRPIFEGIVKKYQALYAAQ